MLLLIGFFNNADPNGGAMKDFFYHNSVMLDFSNNFTNTFKNYHDYSTRHSPFFYSLVSLFYKLDFDVNIMVDCSIKIYQFYCCYNEAKQSDQFPETSDVCK